MVRRWTQELVAWGPDVVHSQCEFSTFFLARRIADIQWCDQYFCLAVWAIQRAMASPKLKIRVLLNIVCLPAL